MAYNTESNMARPSSSAIKDLYNTNIPATNRNEPGEWRRYDRKETEQEIKIHFQSLYQKTGANYVKIAKVNIPASMSQHCNTYIAFMRMENPLQHAEIIEKFTDTKFRGYHLLLSWSSSDPINTAPTRYFELTKGDGSKEKPIRLDIQKQTETNDKIRGLNEQKEAIERAIEFEKHKNSNDANQQLAESRENERRRSLFVTLQNLEVQRKNKEIEEQQKKVQEQKKANETEHIKAMNQVRTREYDISRREIKLILENANIRVRCEEMDKREEMIKRREEEIKRVEERKRKREEEEEEERREKRMRETYDYYN